MVDRFLGNPTVLWRKHPHCLKGRFVVIEMAFGAINNKYGCPSRTVGRRGLAGLTVNVVVAPNLDLLSLYA